MRRGDREGLAAGRYISLGPRLKTNGCLFRGVKKDWDPAQDKGLSGFFLDL